MASLSPASSNGTHQNSHDDGDNLHGSSSTSPHHYRDDAKNVSPLETATQGDSHAIGLSPLHQDDEDAQEEFVDDDDDDGRGWSHETEFTNDFLVILANTPSSSTKTV